LIDDYKEEAPQTPYLFATMYDARISSLADAIDCGMFGVTEVPALASNTFMFASTYVKDERHMMTPKGNATSNAGTRCSEVFDKALSLPDYTSYAFHLASMPSTNASSCDISTNSTNECVMQNILRLEKNLVQSMESMPGVKTSEIWLNLAAIVGGVQFLAWAVQAVLDARE
jgi:hypothetical protein